MYVFVVWYESQFATYTCCELCCSSYISYLNPRLNCCCFW